MKVGNHVDHIEFETLALDSCVAFFANFDILASK